MRKQRMCEKYPGKKIFLLPNGEEFAVNKDYRGKYIGIFLQRIYEKKEDAVDNTYMPRRFRKKKDKYAKHMVEHHRMLINRNTGNERHAVDTMILAKDKSWKDYETVKEYSECCSNTRIRGKIEILLMDEEWSRRVFRSWKGSGTHSFNFFDNIDDLDETLYEEFLDGEHGAKESEYDGITLDFYNDEGETVQIEFENEHDVARRIVSVRLIEYDMEITD